jgi:ComF family protein
MRDTSGSIQTQLGSVPTSVAKHPGRWYRSMSRAALGFFYPAHCIACECPLTPDAQYLCSACWYRLPLVPPQRCLRCSYVQPEQTGSQSPAPIDDPSSCPNCRSWSADPERVLAWARFDDISSDLVHAIKFAGKRRLARLLGYQIGTSRVLREDFNQIDALVPVPLHPTRLRERGYNQSLCIAQGLAEALEIPLIRGLVRRSRATQQQARMDGEGRMENVRGAFEPCTRARDGLLIGLVDDVSTTGATIAACGRALKEGGARSVWGIVVASAFRRS